MESPFEEAQKLTNVWAEFATKLATAGLTMDPSAANSPPDAARNMRDATLSAMSQHAQQFMRSEQFLDMMKKSMDASINWQRQMNEFLTKAHHSTQSVAQSDVDDLHRSVRHLEQRTLDQIEQLASKLDQMSERLEVMEQCARKVSEGQIQACGRES
jgi:ABC-type transporter Mla subunit MlaD